ncbi:DNA alkylation repair protein [Lacinutrix sp. C3R15]|uniref:DNA alkylation repair protein n=1 Tax=Flavobacteriaceae TaxID=49546 RepID=UPI001C09EE39|nr:MULTISPECIES: DNA alkylation repair protein [Flavobacteriaceae]MBU2940472.1 DNA alkylation repair protein [Lacinutrix sp. C3R15]MDO6623792.1 DNA alkylation repair protein [Oceanihabitans sp. 1_MG-2023]
MNFISALDNTFSKNENLEFAAQMKAYLKNRFDFYGIKAKLRRDLLQPLAQKHQLEIRDTIRTLTFDLYQFKQREMHLCAIELFEKQLRKSYKKEDIYLIEKLITTNSWWDSVDFIAKQILGKYLIIHPNETEKIIRDFSNSNNMWLNRCSIIFQLGYKENTNKQLLFNQCLKHKNSNEFFIQKAIGWALREYGSYNPKDVLTFVKSNNLKPLSTREAIRKLI